jgi:hypothetical protein
MAKNDATAAMAIREFRAGFYRNPEPNPTPTGPASPVTTFFVFLTKFLRQNRITDDSIFRFFKATASCLRIRPKTLINMISRPKACP